MHQYTALFDIRKKKKKKKKQKKQLTHIQRLRTTEWHGRSVWETEKKSDLDTNRKKKNCEKPNRRINEEIAKNSGEKKKTHSFLWLFPYCCKLTIEFFPFLAIAVMHANLHIQHQRPAIVAYKQQQQKICLIFILQWMENEEEEEAAKKGVKTNRIVNGMVGRFFCLLLLFIPSKKNEMHGEKKSQNKKRKKKRYLPLITRSYHHWTISNNMHNANG